MVLYVVSGLTLVHLREEQSSGPKGGILQCGVFFCVLYVHAIHLASLMQLTPMNGVIAGQHHLHDKNRNDSHFRRPPPGLCLHALAHQ
jgi:hypothetical protein